MREGEGDVQHEVTPSMKGHEEVECGRLCRVEGLFTTESRGCTEDA